MREALGVAKTHLAGNTTDAAGYRRDEDPLHHPVRGVSAHDKERPALLLRGLPPPDLASRYHHFSQGSSSIACVARRVASAISLSDSGTSRLIERGGHGRLSLATLTASALIATGAFGAFLRIEVRAAEPTVDFRLFRRVAFSAGLAASFLNFVAMASNMFLMPFFLQEALGMSVGRAGAVMMVMPLGVLLAAPVAGKMADRVGSRLPATLGMALITAAIALMSTFTDGVAVAEVAAVLLVYGVGAGLFQSPNISGVLGAAPADRLGVASGTLSTLGRLGQVVGVAVAGGLWQQGASGASSGAAGFRPAFLVLALFGVLAAVASWLRGPVQAHTGVAAGHLPPQPG